MRMLTLVPLALVAVAVSGCGASGTDVQRANAAGQAAGEAKAAASASAAAERAAALASLQAQIDSLKSAAAAAPTSTASPAAPAPAPAARNVETTSCGDNVSAGGTTSCSFALNVASAWRYDGNGTSTVTAYSPVTKEMITMRCVAGVPVVCRGGRAAVVYIR